MGAINGVETGDTGVDVKMIGEIVRRLEKKFDPRTGCAVETVGGSCTELSDSSPSLSLTWSTGGRAAQDTSVVFFGRSTSSVAGGGAVLDTLGIFCGFNASVSIATSSCFLFGAATGPGLVGFLTVRPSSVGDPIMLDRLPGFCVSQSLSSCPLGSWTRFMCLVRSGFLAVL